MQQFQAVEVVPAHLYKRRGLRDLQTVPKNYLQVPIIAMSKYIFNHAQLRFALSMRIGNMSLREAGALCGVSASTLSRIDRGSPPDMETFAMLCSFVGQSPDAFFIDVRVSESKQACNECPPPTFNMLNHEHRNRQPD